MYEYKHIETGLRTCHDGQTMPSEFTFNYNELLKSISYIQDVIKTQIYVIEGWRSKSWNNKLGGEKNSPFLSGGAALLIVLDTDTNKTLYETFAKAIKDKKIKGEVQEYSKNFVYYTTRTPKETPKKVTKKTNENTHKTKEHNEQKTKMATLKKGD